VDRDDGDFEPGDLEDDVDDDMQLPDSLIAKNRILHSKKIVHMGKTLRFQVELPLHLMKCEFFARLVDKARKMLQAVESYDGRHLELLDPPARLPHNIMCEFDAGVEMETYYAKESCKDFFVYVPLYIIAIFFFHDPPPDPLSALFTFPHVGFFVEKFVDMKKRFHTRGREAAGGASINCKGVRRGRVKGRFLLESRGKVLGGRKREVRKRWNVGIRYK